MALADQLALLDEASDKLRRAGKIIRRLQAARIALEEGDPDSDVVLTPAQRTDQRTLAIQLVTEGKAAAAAINTAP